jgi:uncharacterized membrane protein
MVVMNNVIKHDERDKRFAHYVESLPDFRVDLRKWSFWRSAFIVFLFFSILGHVLEYFWWWGLNLGDKWQFPSALVAEPYGFGALAILLLVYPLVRRRKFGVVGTFIAGLIVTTAVEFLCALVSVLFYGYNPYWDYSNDFLNLFGFVCLENSLAFGLVALVFVYFIFPWLDNTLLKLNNKILNAIVVVVAVWYLTSLISQLLGFGRIIL